MAEEIYPGIYRAILPLPRNPLKAINSYIIPGDDRNLIVDTGMNRPECREVLDRELEMIGIDPSSTDVFVTHMHADHLGLAPHITKGETTVFMGKEDIAVIDDGEYWRKMLKYAVMNGFPNLNPYEAIKKHPGYKYGPLGTMNLKSLEGGERIEVGDFDFTTIHTPGHSSGHMCLYDRGRKLLFSGDHILESITPNVSLWSEEEDHLSDYIKSLQKVRRFNISIALPGHRDMIRNVKERIDELIIHHQERAQEVLSIIGDREMDALSIASEMTWDMSYESFQDFPIMQKWFALGESIAHIRYLERGGKVRRRFSKGIIRYHSK